MLTHQTTCLGTQFEDRQAGCVVHIERCPQQVVEALVEAFPLVGTQLTVKDLRALYLAAVRDESVDQLHVGHFQ